MSQSSAIALELPLAIPAKVGRARFNGSPTRLRVLPSVGKRELVLRHRPSKPLRKPLSAAEVLEHQRTLIQLKAEESALFSVAGPSAETRSELTSEAVSAPEAAPVAEAAPASQPVQEAVQAPVVTGRAERHTDQVELREHVESRDHVELRGQPESRERVAPRERVVSRERSAPRERVLPADEPIVVNTVWRRAALPAGVFVLAAGVGAYMLAGPSAPDAASGDSAATASLQSQSSADAAGSQPASKEVVRWKTAAESSSAKAEQLSGELVTISKQNKSLTRKVGLLEAETLDLQTELLERELDVVSLTAELEDVTDRRTIYNITNLPIDGGPAPASADEEVYTPPPVVETSIGVAEPSGYSTAGQAMNAGNL